MANISILDKKNCTGCRTCEQICPFNAIKMVENKEGFIEPLIIKEKCTNCSVCSKICPQLNDVQIKRLEKIEAYAGKNRNTEIQKQSSSGGIFSALAEYVLDNNGVVYGCAFNENMNAEHIRIETKEELYKLRGSKYIQSNTKNTFKDAKNQLEKSKMVLYSGTPCQIAGLIAFLGKEYANLVTIDLVCHGVPSPKLFEKYKDWLEEKNNSKVVSYDFSNKEKNGWGVNAKFILENGKVKYFKAEIDPYYKSFLNSTTYRESCYKCKYSNTNRIGDITLADYWGIDKIHPDFYDEKGISAILVNTQKGKNFLEKLNKELILLKSKVENVSKQNHNLTKASIRNDIRNGAYKDIDNFTFKKYIKRNLKFKKNLIDIIKNIIPKSIKQRIKNTLRR